MCITCFNPGTVVLSPVVSMAVSHCEHGYCVTQWRW
jgi:hypothetical protein